MRSIKVGCGIRESKKPATVKATEVCREAFKRGLIIATYGYWGQVLRFFPPFVTTKEQFDKATEIVDESLKAVEKKYR